MHFPSEDEYFQMTSSKTGVIPRLISNMVCKINGVEEQKTAKISYMTDKLGIAFQIQDDVIALESDAYAETRGIVGEDIHEGKRTLMVIHSYENLPEKQRNRLLEILKMHTEDKETIKEAIELIKSTDSINYAKSVAEGLINR
jgi:geranylgeranyl pyrophosphate synthase